MNLNQLLRYHHWFYLGSMDTLEVFDAASGMRVALWKVEYPTKFGWEFVCKFNHLPNLGFNDIIEKWEKAVETKLIAYASGN